MKIASTQFSLKDNAFEIYTAGCIGPYCEGCHNPELWNFFNGESFSDEWWNKTEEKIKEFDSIIKKIMIFGGEPLDNPKNEIIDFLEKINSLNKEVWLFTRKELSEIPIEIKELCNYIKTGRYEKNKKSIDNIQYGIKLASKNQKIHKKGKDY